MDSFLTHTSAPYITAEMDPPRGAYAGNVLKNMAVLKGRISAWNVTDSPLGIPRMSAIAFAYLVEQKLGIPTIFHITTRDRNRVAIQSEILGAHALGLRSVLALGGDHPATPDWGKGVFDLDTITLLDAVSSLNAGRNLQGKELKASTKLTIGAAANPTASNLDQEVARLQQKLDAGAQFIQTQPIYDPEKVVPFAQKVASLGVPILYGIMPPKNLKSIQYMQENVPGMAIPNWVIERMTKNDTEEEGVDVVVGIAKELLPLGQGLHIFPNRRPSLVSLLLDQILNEPKKSGQP